MFGAGYKYAKLQITPFDEDKPLITSDTNEGDIENNSDSQKEEPQEIIVHVAGAVQKPGVYRLPAGSRVGDAVNLAGSTEDSALDYLNLAAPLEDGKKIMVFSLKDIESQQQKTNGATVVINGDSDPVQPVYYTGSDGDNASGQININNASQSELEGLPGIGPALAQRIIDYRVKSGPFLTKEDIMNVSGIGEKRFEQLKDMIVVD